MFEFSFSREIEDRLLAPMPIPLVAVEKMVFATLRGLIAAGLMIPIGLLMVDVSWPASGLVPAALMIVLGAVTGATIGMVLGTAIPPQRINVMFAVIFTPLLFTGSVQYPWRTLSDLRWFQVLSALNPLTYVSEGSALHSCRRCHTCRSGCASSYRRSPACCSGTGGQRVPAPRAGLSAP